MPIQFRLLTGLIFRLVCVLSSASSAFADDPEVGFKPSFDATKCPVALPPSVRDGVDVRCGYVTVPESHAQPNGKTIQLAVAVVQALGDRTVADPIVILDGGPGLPSISSTLPFVAGPAGQPLRETGRDLVLIEQRGNYYSKPALTCPEVFAALRVQSANLAPPPPGTDRGAIRDQPAPHRKRRRVLMRRFAAGLAAFFALAGVAVSASPTAAVAEEDDLFKPRFEKTACPGSLLRLSPYGMELQDEQLTSNPDAYVLCGYVTVPEHHDRCRGCSRKGAGTKQCGRPCGAFSATATSITALRSSAPTIEGLMTGLAARPRTKPG